MKKIIIAFAAIILAFLACNRGAKELTKAKDVPQTQTRSVVPNYAAKTTTVENFDQFYRKFHYDSLFQISRVKFPLEGYHMDSLEQKKEWHKENWLMHRNSVQTIDTTIFKVDIKKLDNQYQEKVIIEGGGFALEREFKRINGVWYLVRLIDEDL